MKGRKKQRPKARGRVTVRDFWKSLDMGIPSTQSESRQLKIRFKWTIKTSSQLLSPFNSIRVNMYLNNLLITPQSNGLVIEEKSEPNVSLRLRLLLRERRESFLLERVLKYILLKIMCLIKY